MSGARLCNAFESRDACIERVVLFTGPPVVSARRQLARILECTSIAQPADRQARGVLCGGACAAKLTRAIRRYHRGGSGIEHKGDAITREYLLENVQQYAPNDGRRNKVYL